MKTPVLFLSLLLLTTSCASYVRRMHQSFDSYESRRQNETQDELAIYKKRSSKVTSAKRRFLSPKVKRQYKSKRYRAKDLDDNSNDSSLWSGSSGNQGFLFGKNKVRGLGDIVLLQVQPRLKNEITSELKRVFPSYKKNKTAEAGDKKAPKGEEKSPVSEEGGSVTDVISSVIINEVNNHHVLLQGRKQILFKNRKRLIEIQVLASRNDIQTDDTLFSNKIIENQIKIIR